MSALRALSERMLAGEDLPTGLPVAPGPAERLPGGVLLAPSFANVGAIPTSEGLVLVDTGGLMLAERAQEDLRTLTGDRVRMAIYTHGHVDHVMGGALLGDEVEVVAHERVPARFERYRRSRGWNAIINGRQFGLRELEWPAAFREPDRTFHDALDVELGGERLELRHARGETDDHLYVWVPERRVLFCADYFTWSLPNAGNPQKAQRYPVEWAAEEFVVRAIWRTFGGWWDGDVASLKPAPNAALASEVASLAGGAQRLAQRAREVADAGDLRLATDLARLAELSGAEGASEIYALRAAGEPSLMARGIYGFFAQLNGSG